MNWIEVDETSSTFQHVCDSWRDQSRDSQLTFRRRPPEESQTSQTDVCATQPQGCHPERGICFLFSTRNSRCFPALGMTGTGQPSTEGHARASMSSASIGEAIATDANR
jgi:hypothetical protein